MFVYYVFTFKININVCVPYIFCHYPGIFNLSCFFPRLPRILSENIGHTVLTCGNSMKSVYPFTYFDNYNKKCKVVKHLMDADNPSSDFLYSAGEGVVDMRKLARSYTAISSVTMTTSAGSVIL